MKINVLNFANKMPAWVQDGCNEYLKRINHGKYSCQIIEIKGDKNPHKTPVENMEAEAKKFTANLAKNSFVVVLDERGKKLNSINFAQELEKSSLNYPVIDIIIGGADGVHPELRARANVCISLSDLVFPHALVRVIILEQIYRAISILENHPYHRE